MKIIFLDVDGVLNSKPYFDANPGVKEINEFNLKQLAKIYWNTGAKIVLSSTWRDLDCNDIQCQKMYQYLTDSLRKYGMYIFSKTPIVGFNRPLEIVTWNRLHYGVEQFISLDDDFPKEEYMKYGIEDNLISTKFFCNTEEEGGLQDRHVKKAIEMLNRKSEHFK